MNLTLSRLETCNKITNNHQYILILDRRLSSDLNQSWDGSMASPMERFLKKGSNTNKYAEPRMKMIQTKTVTLNAFFEDLRDLSPGDTESTVSYSTLLRSAISRGKLYTYVDTCTCHTYYCIIIMHVGSCQQKRPRWKIAMLGVAALIRFNQIRTSPNTWWGIFLKMSSLFSENTEWFKCFHR